MPPTFHVENFGCRAARADGEAIAGQLLTQGCAPALLQQAEVVVVNTCSVTAEADRAARALIRRTHRLNPAARIVVTGCYAQRAPQELAQLPGVVAVVGNSHKALAPQIISDLLNAGAPISANLAENAGNLGNADLVSGHGLSRAELPPATTGALAPAAQESAPLVQLTPNQPFIAADDSFAHSFLEEAQITPGAQTRPNLKVQEGCSNHCTFCVIPATRGPSRSLPAAAILKQVQGFVAAGGNELVLSGINLGRWGVDLRSPNGPRLSLAFLVQKIFAETALPRLRLSSVEPMDWDSDLIAILRAQKSPRLARHAHLPLQSGSDAVLRRMHRRYRPWHYAEKVAALFAAAGPELTLGADVLVGFPGETEAEFAETFEFIQKLPFAYLHLFPFSARPGTPAEALHRAHPVPPQAVGERMKALRALAAHKAAAHRLSFVGHALPAITLHTPAAVVRRNRTAALSDNFLPIELEGRLPANRLLRVTVTGSMESPKDGILLLGRCES